MSRTIYARRIDGDLYSITYSDSRMSEEMPSSYIERQLRDGDVDVAIVTDAREGTGTRRISRRTYRPDRSLLDQGEHTA